ncbi:MAG: thioredoxin [Chloroflexi bacterium]|nr:MAG: thioredoxin [Chloroflexota bacterium]
MGNTDNIIDVTEETFEADVLERSEEVPVIVDFWAPWCGPCRMLSPILERLADDPDYDFILAKVNVDDNPNLSMEFRVQGIPAVLAFVDGHVVGNFVGAQSEGKIKEFLQEVIPSEIDEELDEAKSLLATHHWKTAETAYRQILISNPEHPVAMINLARALLAQGKGCEAIGYLQDCKDGQELAQAERLMPLARQLCDAKTRWSDEDEISAIEAQFRQAIRLYERGNISAALDGLIGVLRQEKRFRKGLARDIMLATFELLGESDNITLTYRQELAFVLF